ncbi:anaerobic carbon-monoxide dehydrogenase catalytic subunit [Tepidibacter aestuarii]|uniref:anaerobic carbon-monoxide dehydrogenase catalytic subunit n=1 Tax=Tepidibacter aestuarii TaxID=2925782 RepID=UPI0020BDDB54|nr:anaerobic carbon-monoxide dehydrogenase catalytic subunit [Tepidibacter aestuarii]CAH2212407.1 Carbon monoxide dehydrogenase 1 [Tepidibacter aestuarii]
MDEKLLSIDNATNELIKKAQTDGVETIWDRKENMKPCPMGEKGICCRICAMGPCRITPKTPRGLCGASPDVIVSRNFARMVAAGAAAHSDHGRDIAHVLHMSSKDGNYKVRDEAKLINLAKRWEIETDERDIYDIAHEVAGVALNEFGKPFGNLTLPPSLPEQRRKVWEDLNIVPRAIDREVVTVMHSTHVGCTADADSMLNISMRTSLADGWGGSYMATELSDILFGTPIPRETEANLGVLEENYVNIVLHGHEPSLSEMIVLAAEDPELVALAKEVGAEGINLAGMCCTANEVTMRHGVKIAGNFAQQELAVLTGAVEAVIVDVQCIFPALASLTDCYHTKFITTSPKARITGATHLEFDEEKAFESAKSIVKEAILNFSNRDNKKVFIPKSKSHAIVGYSVEAIINQLDKVVNSHIDPAGTVKPLADCITSGVIRGAAGIVGCNNPKVKHDYGHIELIKELIKNDVIVVVTGCAAQACAKAGLLSKDAKRLAGQGLATVCELVDIPPVLHMGSCVDISRILHLVGEVAKFLNVDIPQLPVVGAAPEWMSEKAVAIGTYVVSSGIDTWLGVAPPVTGGPRVLEILTNELENIVGAKFFVEPDPVKAAGQIIERIEQKRKVLEEMFEKKEELAKA